MKRTAAVLLLMALLVSLMPAAMAVSYQDNLPEYVVESFDPNGYCYLYSKASSSSGKNLGRHDNGEIVKVISHDGSWYRVVCSNGKVGYIHDYVLTSLADTQNRERYWIYSTDPYGYCYLYDKPSSSKGKNLGRYENGEYVQIVDWYADENYAKVFCERTGKYGYINKKNLMSEGDPPVTPKPTKRPTAKPTAKPTPRPTARPTAIPTVVPWWPTAVPTARPTATPNYSVTLFYAQISSNYPAGFCYVYQQPNEYSWILGQHDNTEWVRVIDWDSNWNFALVECLTDGTIGYIRKDSLSIR